MNISYTQPYLLGRDIAAGFDIIRRFSDYTQNYTYDQERTGFVLRAGYALSDNLRQSLNYSFFADQITNIQSNASIYIVEQRGLALPRDRAVDHFMIAATPGSIRPGLYPQPADQLAAWADEPLLQAIAKAQYYFRSPTAGF